MTEQKKGWFQRLSEGLSRTSRQMTDQVAGALTKRPLDQAQLDELEEMLIEADLGPTAAARITAAFAEERFGRQADEQDDRREVAHVGADRADHGPTPVVAALRSGAAWRSHGVRMSTAGAVAGSAGRVPSGVSTALP